MTKVFVGAVDTGVTILVTLIARVPATIGILSILVITILLPLKAAKTTKVYPLAETEAVLSTEKVI
jgi:hypothetical protein